MAARITSRPKPNSDGTFNMGSRVSRSTREGLVAIAQRRGEPLNDTINKAFSQYIAGDARKRAA